MKRNITANLCGSLYNIDEDAYALLNKYLDDTRAFFSRQPDGREITDDIEARVSELMAEMCSTGSRIVTIEDVQTIIQRVGTPEEMGEEETSGTPPPPPFPDSSPEAGAKPKDRKKLFRDLDHRMLGGVLAGFGQYFDINPLWLRLIAIALTLVGYGMTIPVYLLLWILMPAAVTPAERLQMKGEPVNMESLGDEIINNASSRMDVRNDNSFINQTMHLLCVVLKAILAVCGVGAVILLGGTAIWMIIFMAWATFIPESFMAEALGLRYEGGIDIHLLFPVVPTWGLFLFGLMTIAITIYLIIFAMMRMAGKELTLPRWGLGLTLIAWAVGLIISAGCLGIIIGNMNNDNSEFNRTVRRYRHEQEQKATDESLAELKSSGWTLVKGRNVRSYLSSGEDYRDIQGRRYLNAWQRSGDMDYEVTRQVKTAPGQYTLTAAGRANGDGAEIFAVNGDKRRYASMIPAYGDTGGEIWQEAGNFTDADTLKTSALYTRMARLAGANKGQGYGWSRVTVEGITVGPDSILTYGVTNCSPDASCIWDGTWLSASDFELKRTK